MTTTTTRTLTAREYLRVSADKSGRMRSVDEQHLDNERAALTEGWALRDADLFSEEYLLARPLLAALDHPGPRPAVLLIDEVDRGDDEFEAFLFELLAESAVTIPELGTRRAKHPPVVVLT